MYNSGMDSANDKFLRTPEIMARYAGLIMPLFMIIHGGFFINFNPTTYQMPETLTYILASIFWVIIAVLQFSKGRLISEKTKIIANHLLMMYFTIYVTGFTPLMAVSWMTLFFETTTVLKNIASILSISALFLTYVGRILIEPQSTLEIGYVSMFVAVLIFVCFIVRKIVTAFKESQSNLVDSRKIEIAQKDQLSTMINSLTDAVINTDKNGVITTYNAATLNVLNTNDSLNDKYIGDILKLTDERGNKYDIRNTMKGLQGIKVEEDLSYSFNEEETLRLEVTISPIKNAFSGRKKATVKGYIVILHDITKAKTLEDEKDEFIGVISHELRTPVTVVEGSISNLQLLESRGALNRASLKATLDTTHDQIIYLAKIINDLSTISRVERGVMSEPEDINLKEIMEIMFKKYLPEAMEKNQSLNLDIKNLTGAIKTSRLYLEETLQNFVINAIKYTPEGGSITLSAKKTAKSVTFSVADNGIGISKADQRRIFDKFYRSEDYRTRETNGTGLGLYVSTKLAKIMRGKIELESKLNHGSTFSLTLPR